jgi:hypothetical protein
MSCKQKFWHVSKPNLAGLIVNIFGTELQVSIHKIRCKVVKKDENSISKHLVNQDSSQY